MEMEMEGHPKEFDDKKLLKTSWSVSQEDTDSEVSGQAPPQPQANPRSLPARVLIGFGWFVILGALLLLFMVIMLKLVVFLFQLEQNQTGEVIVSTGYPLLELIFMMVVFFVSLLMIIPVMAKSNGRISRIARKHLTPIRNKVLAGRNRWRRSGTSKTNGVKFNAGDLSTAENKNSHREVKGDLTQRFTNGKLPRSSSQ